MHYNLLFNGCSFTAGAELEGINRDKEYQRTHRFSHLVAEHFGKTYDNISKSGASNDRIARTTIEWFEKGNTCDLAIIQWSRIERLEYIHPLHNREININPGLLRTLLSDAKHRSILHDHFTEHLVKSYYRDVYNNYYGFYVFYKNLFLLEQYFEKNNINHYFMKLRNTKTETEDQTTIWKNICHSKYIDIVSISGDILSEKINTEDYCLDLNDNNNPHLEGTHPSEIGHEKIANYLIKEINNAL